jgi:hypothetical protein
MKKRGAKGPELRKEGAKWIERINAAGKFEKNWLDDASKAVKAYTNEAKAEGEADVMGCTYDYNILYANVETIVPAVINSQPIPDIRRRFGDADPVARRVADIIERAIRVQTDDNRLQIEMEGAAQDSFLAGRGIIRLRFKSDIVGGETTDEEIESADDSDDRRDAADPDTGYAPDGEGEYGESRMGLERSGADKLGKPQDVAGTPERLENERIPFEAISWRDYRHGPAKRWDERLWDAYRFSIPREEESDTFDPGLIASQLNDSEKTDRSGAADELTGWEVWCKKSRKVKFIDDDGVILKVVDDPLGLTNFFPICTPMQPIEITGRLKPVNPFSIYRKLADELDDITKRINKLVDAMRVKGWYAGSAKDLETVVSLGDNEFAPIADAEIWASHGGIEGAIAFWPIERFIAVLKELYVAREQTKQAIYEITGISDIVRGASNAAETATAQNIKSQWGSLRIQKMQRMMERAARDLFVMMAEIITTKFSLETLEKMTAVAIIPQPNDTPEEQQIKQGAIELMKQRVAAYYRIDVESDSTIRADLTRQKQEVSEFLQGAAAYFQAVAPLVQEGALPADAAVDIFASTARMFNLGKSVEDTLEKMVVDAKAKASQPQPEKPDPEMVKAQIEQQKAQMDGQKTQAEMGMKQQEMQMRMQEFGAKMQFEAAKAEREGQSAQIEAAIKLMDQELKGIELQIRQVELQRLMATPVESGEAHKPPSESISFKDLPPEGQAQMAAQAGIMISPQEMAAHQATLDAKEAEKAAAKAKKEPAE